MSVSVFEHPILSGLLGDEPIAAQFALSAEITAMLRFETALAVAEEEAGAIPKGAAAAIATACNTLKPDIAALRDATARDGVSVPELVRQLRAMLNPDLAAHVHFAATSQDVIDTALVLRLEIVLEEIRQPMDALVALLDTVDARFGNRELMAHTRMQRAVPIKVSDKLSSWREPLVEMRDALGRLQKTVLRLQFGGAAGTLDRLGDKKAIVSARLAKEVGLADRGCWHTNRTPFAELAGWLSQLTGVLGKIGQDIALMAQNEVGGTSSALAHKQNPVAAEILVTLARFNAAVVSGMHSALVHENERSGSAWTLEWMLLPQMVVAAGCALSTATRLVGSIEDLSAETNSGPNP
ncbi:MAG: 3-carboxy-cis,cis-muconate cycloisomerase [Hyphomicrobiales bacterium]|nr:3-carboxy-cis,cis-muconate cycloisomerase [Hyphomicrobiales bacterium]MCP4997832.1 3-carboxy-cis,cis-muconate cycloisomerase [Hyphomicrobiales bacterium]